MIYTLRFTSYGSLRRDALGEKQMNRQIQLPSFGNSEISRTVDVELLEIASYGRNPLWRASDHNWPSNSSRRCPKSFVRPSHPSRSGTASGFSKDSGRG